MLKNNYVKGALFFLSILPMICFLPFLLNIWKNSPLDRFDGIFIIMAILCLFIFLKRIKGWCLDYSYKGIIPIIMALLIIVLGYKTSTHLLMYVGALTLIWSMLFLLWGERMFIGISPLFLLFMFAVPSSTYWVEYFAQSNTGISYFSGLQIKLFVAFIILAYFVFSKNKIALNTFFFIGGLLLLSGLLFLNMTPPKFGHPLPITQTKVNFGNWLGIEKQPTPQEESFFKDCLLKKLVFFKGKIPIYLLSIQLGNHVNAIHPSEICLKSAGNIILSSKEEQCLIGKTQLAYQKIIFRNKNYHFLLYTWYTSNRFSTGNFIIFRRAWKQQTLWNTYQLMTPIRDVTSGEKDAENILKSFLTSVVENSPLEK